MGKRAGFSPAVTKNALRIMQKISKHPCARIFLEPVDPAVVPGYYDRIIEPVDISMVNLRLNMNDYKQISEWVRDMKLIWQNAEKFYGQSSFQAALGRELFRIFEREYERFVEFSVMRWVKCTTLTAYKFNYFVMKMPDSLRGVHATTFSLMTGIPSFGDIDLEEAPVEQPTNLQPQIPDPAPTTELPVKEASPPPAPEPEPKIETEKKPHHTQVDDSCSSDDCFDSVVARRPVVRKQSRRRGPASVSDQDVTNLMCALALLPNAEDLREVAAILIRSQPELRIKLPNPVISTEDLTNQTLRMLMEFAHRRFRELDLEYPSGPLIA